MPSVTEYLFVGEQNDAKSLVEYFSVTVLNG